MPAHLRRGGTPCAGLAGRAGAAAADRRVGSPLTACGASAVRGAAGRRPGRLRAQAVCDPPPGGAIGGRRRRPRGRVHDRQPVLAAAVLQGPADRLTASGLLSRPVRSGLRERAGARALALFHQHAGHLGPGPPLQPAGPQRRDQHRARQCQLDGCARAAAALAASGRRPAEAVSDRRGAVVGLGQAGCGDRAAGAGRAVAGACAGHAHPARLDRPGFGHGRRAAGLLRVPRMPGRAVGRPGRRGGNRRPPGGGGARPKRAAAGPLPAHPRRPGGAGIRGRRARAGPRPGGRVGAPGARRAAGHGHRRGPHPARRGGARRAGRPAALPALAGQPPGGPGRPSRGGGGRARRRHPGAAAASIRVHRRRARTRHLAAGAGRGRARRLDGGRHPGRGAVGPAAVAAGVLQAGLRAGNEPAHRLPAGVAGNEPADVGGRDRKPAGGAARALPEGGHPIARADRRAAGAAAKRRPARLPRGHAARPVSADRGRGRYGAGGG